MQPGGREIRTWPSTACSTGAAKAVAAKARAAMMVNCMFAMRSGGNDLVETEDEMMRIPEAMLVFLTLFISLRLSRIRCDFLA